MVELIIFDWDDVFTLGSKEGYFACYKEAAESVGTHLSDEELWRRIKAKWGKSHREELKEILTEYPERVPEAVEIYESHLFGDTFVDSLQLVQGSVELILRLKDTYKLAIASGVHPKLLKERIMPAFQIPNIFAQIITAYDIDDPEKTKPHPFIAEKIMHDQGSSKEKTVMVGDAASDVAMATSAGITPVVVLTGQLDRTHANNLGVKYIIDDVSQLEQVLAKL